ncbi:23S rRNA (pseudouridine(1915)-N(3))-methyltransferase RlmH [Geothrix sp. PMB-07]|uniref:23S rRNA (pseudouridine(1915)-N(3))-methyltransferase RlmH n=1 Tax=Geothrix sp. PMB-07 TaxID=3068640 RepID=UPI00274226F6|nr:23S rRNA (pseudouridine(1915)-N(3))-methyltransferase RlmH [Geothrix sp. PMB-07]WLT31871.1 23S rRNA (pseudouridine(1915)-N(3))-methyltransferase RlmH [Geothrix sp. PMB-07]
MYPIHLLAFGRLRLEPCRSLERHYLDMLRAYARMEVTELPEGKGDATRQLKEEADRLRPKLAAVRCPVLLTPEGKMRDSEGLAQWLVERMNRGESLAFALGSSHGFDPALKKEIPEQMSLSPMTFPHELSRVMFLEQLYRAFTIIRGKDYHK